MLAFSFSLVQKELFNFGNSWWAMTENKINAHVGNQLRRRRMMMGLSQEAVGKGVGVAAQQVQKYEKGANVMSVVRLYEFAEFLKVPVEYFYDGLSHSAAAKFSEDSESFDHEIGGASDRETLEVLKSFKRIRDRSLRKRIADLLRTMSLKNI